MRQSTKDEPKKAKSRTKNKSKGSIENPGGYQDQNSDHLYSSKEISKPSPPTQDNRYSNSVFKVNVFTKFYNDDEPWNAPSQSAHSGSGFGLTYGGKTFLLTNAHVASVKGRMSVRLPDDSKEYDAKVVLIEHDCDLALIEVKDQRFLKKLKPLSLGEIPNQLDKIRVYGFPVGGDELCITEGKVSRIEVSAYAEGSTNLLQAQVSAEINSGNSGGPAINKEGKIIGVAFQGMDGDGLGFVIPPPIIEHFVKECLKPEDYKGFPDLQFDYQTMNNKFLRKQFGLQKGETGIRVSSVPPLSSAQGLLKKDDIILKIDGTPVKNDGTVKMSFNKRLSFDYLFSKHFIGDTIEFEVLRNQEKIKVSLPLLNRAKTTKMVQFREEETRPSYFFVSGVALCPLTLNVAEDIFGSLSHRKVIDAEKKQPGEEYVFIRSVLACKQNKGYDSFEGQIVKTINDIKIHNLRDAVRAVESNKSNHHIIETHDNSTLVLPNLDPLHHKKLLNEFDIRSDRSRDLKAPPMLKPGSPEAGPFLPWYESKKNANKESNQNQDLSQSSKAEKLNRLVV